MARTISIGCQNYETIRREGYFYIDKTSFIKEWWESGRWNYTLTLTNKEADIKFANMIRGWFSDSDGSYGEFIKSLLNGFAFQGKKVLIGR